MLNLLSLLISRPDQFFWGKKKVTSGQKKQQFTIHVFVIQPLKQWQEVLTCWSDHLNTKFNFVKLYLPEPAARCPLNVIY